MLIGLIAENTINTGIDIGGSYERFARGPQLFPDKQDNDITSTGSEAST
jgi:hypothetical protein